MSAASPSTLTKQLRKQYDMSRGMLARLAEDFTPEEATRRAGSHKPLVWFLGHVAVTDNYFLTLFGGHESAIPEERLARYGRGSDGSADFSDASLEELIAVLDTLKERVHAVIAALAPEDLERAPATPVGHPAFKNLGSALALVVSHCAYHAGQIGDLRRELGKDPIFG